MHASVCVCVRKREREREMYKRPTNSAVDSPMPTVAGIVTGDVP